MPGWLRHLVHVAQMILGSSPTNACTYVQVCGWNGSAAMLAANRSTGVTPEVNLRNTLPVGNEAYKPGIILALKFRADITNVPKQGTQPSGVRWICTWQYKVFYNVVSGSPGTPFRGRICIIMQTMVVNISESITCF